MQSMYKCIAETWRDKKSEPLAELQWARKIDYRKEESFVRVERPSRLDRARALGYKAKPGFIVIRARVRRGGLQKRLITAGRKPKRKGINKITMKKNIQWIAEERVAKRFTNLAVLNSYYIGEDGKHKYYEIILVDPSHPVIKSDPKMAWLNDPANKGRVYRGLTSAGKRARGLRWKGKGSEGARPSRAANVSRTRRTQYKALP
jgi:large subunit ribosomal protein L15e